MEALKKDEKTEDEKPEDEKPKAEEEEINLVGTYGISKIENLFKNSTEEQAYTTTMPTSSSLRQYATIKTIEGDTTSVAEIDLTITKTADGYSFNWAKCNIDGVAASEETKSEMVKNVGDKYWNNYTEMFAIFFPFSFQIFSGYARREHLQGVSPENSSRYGSIRPTWIWNISGKAASTASFPDHM